VGFSELDSLMVWLVPLLGSSCFLSLRPHMISYLVLFNSREDREHDEFGASGSACLSAEKPNRSSLFRRSESAFEVPGPAIQVVQNQQHATVLLGSAKTFSPPIIIPLSLSARKPNSYNLARHCYLTNPHVAVASSRGGRRSDTWQIGYPTAVTVSMKKLGLK
jgi:hypothetical protein